MDFNSFNQHLNDYLNETALPGFSLALCNREQLLHRYTYTSNRVTDKPITNDTLFEVGSIGKSFTSILIQQLVDAGDYDLDKPIIDYLPWFEVQTAYDPITTHHLLCHSAGLINGTGSTGHDIGEVYSLRDTQTAFQPGTHFHYSNVGYKLLGVALEHVTGISYQDLVRERILKPLSMDASYPALIHDARSEMATGYVPLYDDRPAPLDNPIAPGIRLINNTADGCIISNPTDLIKYLQIFIQEGCEGVLSSAAYQRMIQASNKISDSLICGYGLFITETEHGQIIGHSGSMAGGYVSQMWWHVESGNGFIAMFNSLAIPGTQEIVNWIKSTLPSLTESAPESIAPPSDPFIVENAEEYSGTYSSTDGKLDIQHEDNRLFLRLDNESQPMAKRQRDHFTVALPDYDRFMFSFQRDEDRKIKSVVHGEAIYFAEGHPAKEVDYPAEWDVYRGHYRSHNPWLIAFRILLRGDKLIFQMGSYEDTLVPFENGHFRIGQDERSPERIHFSLILNGKAIQAHFNTATYYRTFIP